MLVRFFSSQYSSSLSFMFHTSILSLRSLNLLKYPQNSSSWTRSLSENPSWSLMRLAGYKIPLDSIYSIRITDNKSSMPFSMSFLISCSSILIMFSQYYLLACLKWNRHTLPFATGILLHISMISATLKSIVTVGGSHDQSESTTVKFKALV